MAIWTTRKIAYIQPQVVATDVLLDELDKSKRTTRCTSWILCIPPTYRIAMTREPLIQCWKGKSITAQIDWKSAWTPKSMASELAYKCRLKLTTRAAQQLSNKRGPRRIRRRSSAKTRRTKLVMALRRSEAPNQIESTAPMLERRRPASSKMSATLRNTRARVTNITRTEDSRLASTWATHKHQQAATLSGRQRKPRF